MDIALAISKSLAEKTVITKVCPTTTRAPSPGRRAERLKPRDKQVNGELWDLERPFEMNSTLELFDFDSPEGGRILPQRARTPLTSPSTGKRVWWHSSAHIVGECCERHYGCNLAIGPPTEEGFYYEMGMTDERCAFSSWSGWKKYEATD